jgi:hypothetical protein
MTDTLVKNPIKSIAIYYSDRDRLNFIAQENGGCSMPVLIHMFLDMYDEALGNIVEAQSLEEVEKQPVTPVIEKSTRIVQADVKSEPVKIRQIKSVEPVQKKGILSKLFKRKESEENYNIRMLREQPSDFDFNEEQPVPQPSTEIRTPITVPNEIRKPVAPSNEVCLDLQGRVLTSTEGYRKVIVLGGPNGGTRLVRWEEK